MRAHRTDLVSLAFGLLFLGLAAWWLLAQILGLALPPVGWFLAGALLLIGALGLLGALRSARHANAAPSPAAADTAPGTGAGPSGADEWPTAAVTDERVDAVPDRAVDAPDDRPPG